MNEHIDPVTGRRYRYKNGQGKQFDITMGAQDPDGKWRYTTSDGVEGYWDPSEVGSLELISEGEPRSTGAQTSTGEPRSTGATEQEKGSESESQSAGDALQNYDGLFDWPDDEEMSPVGTTVADSDWLAGLVPDLKKRERSMKAQKAIDALNMVSQAVQVLGRMPSTHLGAGGAQPMASDAYRKYMDRVYEQGQRYDNSIAARENVLNAGKKLQMDWAVKREKMQLDRELFRLKKEKADAVARQDKKKEAYIDAQIEYVKARKAAVDAGVEMKKDVTDAQVSHYQTMDSVAQTKAANDTRRADAYANKQGGEAKKTEPSKEADDDNEFEQYMRKPNK